MIIEEKSFYNTSTGRVSRYKLLRIELSTGRFALVWINA
jgi:hypothetical protein